VEKDPSLNIDIGLTPDLYKSLEDDILSSVENVLSNMDVSVDFAGLSEVVMPRPLDTAEIIGADFILDIPSLDDFEMPDIVTEWEPTPDIGFVPEPVAPQVTVPVPGAEELIPVPDANEESVQEQVLGIRFDSIVEAPTIPGLEPEVPVVPVMEPRVEEPAPVPHFVRRRSRLFIIIALIIFFFVEMIVVGYLSSKGVINTDNGLFSLFSAHFPIPLLWGAG